MNLTEEQFRAIQRLVIAALSWSRETVTLHEHEAAIVNALPDAVKVVKQLLKEEPVVEFNYPVYRNGEDRQCAVLRCKCRIESNKRDTFVDWLELGFDPDYSLDGVNIPYAIKCIVEEGEERYCEIRREEEITRQYDNPYLEEE